MFIVRLRFVVSFGYENKRRPADFIACGVAKICGFRAISPRIIAKPSCSRVNRSRIIARGVAALKNSPASLQKAFTPMQNGLASSQGRFAALFHILAVVRGTIARLFRRLFWWLWSSVASSSSAGIPHLFPFRAEGVGSADNVKLSPASPMILHLLAPPTSLHLGIAHASMALRSTFGTPVEK